MPPVVTSGERRSGEGRTRLAAPLVLGGLLGIAGCTVILEPVQNETGGGAGVDGGAAGVAGEAGGAGGLEDTAGAGGVAGAGGAAGAAGGVHLADCPLTPNETGWVNRDVSDCLIQGAWYSYNDCPDSPGDCTVGQSPAEGEFPNVAGVMCTSGTTASAATTDDLAAKWGAGIALNLNQGAETDEQLTLSARPPPGGGTIRGFRFRLNSDGGGEIRVNFPTASTLTAPHFVSISASGAYTVLFADAEQGWWATNPMDLYWDQVFSIQFQFPNEVGAGIPFSYCISELEALR